MVKINMFRIENNFSLYRKLILPIIIAALIIMPLIINHPYVMHIMIMVFIYAIVAEAWNILGGYTGQISLGNAMFFGIGAYTSSVLLTKFGINPWIGLIAGGLISAVVGVLIGYPVFKLRGHFFVIATLAAGEILLTIFTNWDYIQGANGIELPLQEDSILNLTFMYNKSGFYYISFLLLIVTVLTVYAITKTKLGYYFRTIKEEEDAAKSLGIDTAYYKLVAIGITALLTAVAGTIYAQYLLYIDPAMVLTTSLSIKFVLVAALGGAGTIMGPVLGAFILIPITEASRVVFGGGGQGVDILIYGILIVVVALFKPDGLINIFSKNK